MRILRRVSQRRSKGTQMRGARKTDERRRTFRYVEARRLSATAQVGAFHRRTKEVSWQPNIALTTSAVFFGPRSYCKRVARTVGAAQLRALEDKHILRVIERQKELGFKIFTDGEFRRGNFMSDFNEAVEGIDEGVAVARTWQTGAGRIVPSFDGARHRRRQDQTNPASDRT